MPFVLQFLIDYNLYGMSFLHVPTAIVKYRQRAEGNADETMSHIGPDQMLERKVERMTVSKHEIDIVASFILNRFQIDLNKNAEHANPGIAFIWNDERARRSQQLGKFPLLSANPEPTSDRSSAIVTESEAFHQEALDKKLGAIQMSSDGSFQLDLTLTNQAADAQRKFNVNQFFQNAIYPSECSPGNISSSKSLLNASCLVDHLSSNNTRDSKAFNATGWEPPSYDMNDSIVDEELILSLTQKSASQRNFLNETLNDDELDMLEVLERLEEETEEQTELEQTIVEDGSLLAPLSQQPLSQTQRQSQIISLTHGAKAEDGGADRSFLDGDSDDDLLNDFSLSMVECLSTADDGNK